MMAPPRAARGGPDPPHLYLALWVIIGMRGDDDSAWRPLSPLLEKDGHPCLLALVPQTPGPVRVHGPCLWAALAASDDPVEYTRRRDAARAQMPYRVALMMRPQPFPQVQRPQERLRRPD